MRGKKIPTLFGVGVRDLFEWYFIGLLCRSHWTNLKGCKILRVAKPYLTAPRLSRQKQAAYLDNFVTMWIALYVFAVALVGLYEG